MTKTSLSLRYFVFFVALIVSLAACSETPANPESEGNTKLTKSYSADVVVKWLGVQTSMLYTPSGNPFGFNPSRYMAYCGVALYESVLPGMPSYRTMHGQLTDMPVMPVAEPGASYHWPIVANAVLADMTRFMFGTTSAYNADAVNNLEDELNSQYRIGLDDATFNRSVAFGKTVAALIFEWSKGDSANWPASVEKPTGAGIWVSENGAAPVNPFWGFNRLMVQGSLDNTVSPPLPYSTDPNSEYYANMMEVYQVSQNLTHEQKRIAKYYNDSNPGYPAGAHYISMLKQLLEQLNPSLEKAALTYAKTGITLFDASTGSFGVKYEHWKERPFSYIREVIMPDAETEWKSYLPTPGFPDFPSNHAVFSTSVAYALSTIYGNKVSFKDASYEGVMADLGNGPENLGTRHFDSFDEMAMEISISRLYGGIHYRYSCAEGMIQGRKIAQNIDQKVKFTK